MLGDALEAAALVLMMAAAAAGVGAFLGALAGVVLVAL